MRKLEKSDKNFELEFDKLSDWWDHMEKLNSARNIIICDYAKIVSKEIRVGRVVYEPGDIVCSFCPGVATVALGGLYIPETCSLCDFRVYQGYLIGRCRKLNKDRAINKRE